MERRTGSLVLTGKGEASGLLSEGEAGGGERGEERGASPSASKVGGQGRPWRWPEGEGQCELKRDELRVREQRRPFDAGSQEGEARGVDSQHQKGGYSRWVPSPQSGRSW